MQFQQAILEFYDLHGRKDLPWQQNKTPYRVWISEIMLQQTQVSTVIPFYTRFTERFPDLESLAKSPLDDVLSLWTGLGYYSRARNLHRCAKQVIEQLNGDWPTRVDDMMALPGIGRSTAGAILSLALAQPAAILDGNVKRVLCRYFAIEGWPGTARVGQHLWQLAESLTPSSNTDDYNQAMMDLGATLCTRRQPDCVRCPIRTNCKAFAANQQGRYPFSKPKSTKPCRNAYFALVTQANRVLLEKRPESGIWGGLWSLPEAVDQSELSIQIARYINLTDAEIYPLTAFKHTFSHFHLQISPIRYEITQPQCQVLDSDRLQWQDLDHLNKLGLPSPVLKLLLSLKEPT